MIIEGTIQMDYKDSLLLPNTKFPMRGNLPQNEPIKYKQWDDKKVYLQSKGGMPIDCFYHIYGERKDTEKLIVEYKGTIEDYPGDNSQRSIVGYHYDTK